MDFIRGSIVKNKAGHQKDKFFVLLKIENGYAFISDGNYRPISKPKKKNLKHLSLTKTVLPEFKLHTNMQIRRALKAFDN